MGPHQVRAHAEWDDRRRAIALATLSIVPLGRFLAAGVFLAGAVAAAFGIKATTAGKVYHRAANAKKALYERALGLDREAAPSRGAYADLSVGALERPKRERILGNVDAYVSQRIRLWSITGAAVVLLWTLLVLDLLGVAVLGYVLAGCPLAGLPCA